MRLPRVRFTVRRMMVAVLCLGIVIHLTSTALRVYRGGRWHVHTAIAVGDRMPAPYVAVKPRPFWPIYWRALLGAS